MASIDGRILLAEIANGRLACSIAQQASECKADTICRAQEVRMAWDEDSSDDEDMSALRRRTKEASRAVVANRCLPAKVGNKLATKPPLVVLQTAIEVLYDLTSQPITPVTPTQTLVLEPVEADDPLLMTQVTTDLSQFPGVLVGTLRPSRPASANSETSRFFSRAALRPNSAMTVSSRPRNCASSCELVTAEIALASLALGRPLPPVNPPRKKSLAMSSAMSLDLGHSDKLPAPCGGLGDHSAVDQARTLTSAGQNLRSSSMSSLRLPKPSSKQAPYITLPSLPGSKGVGAKLGAGSVDGSSWHVSLGSPALEHNTRRLLH